MLTFSREGRDFVLHVEQSLPAPVTEVFDFFADAFQLEAITPSWLRFQIVTAGPIVMRPGLLIDYRLRLHGWPIAWRSEISVWDPPRRFVDRQLRGPYRLWHHEHTFAEQNGRTLVVDHIHYRVPGGRLINAWLVEPDLRRIFEFRQEVLRQRFDPGEKPATNRPSAESGPGSGSQSIRSGGPGNISIPG